MRPLVRLLCPVAAVLILAGCGGEPGVPQPTPSADASSTAQPTTTSERPTTTSVATEVRFDREQLCELLEPAEAAQVGAGNPRPANSTSTGHPQCTWRGETGIVIDFGATGGAAGATGPNVTTTNITIAGTEARLQRIDDAVDLCQVVFELNDGKSGMAVGGFVLSAGEGKYEACDVAKQVAEIVIPKVKG